MQSHASNVRSPEVIAAIGLENASATIGAAIEAVMGTSFREIRIQSADFAIYACTPVTPMIGASNLVRPEIPRPSEQDEFTSNSRWSAADLADSIQNLGK